MDHSVCHRWQRICRRTKLHQQGTAQATKVEGAGQANQSTKIPEQIRLRDIYAIVAREKEMQNITKNKKQHVRNIHIPKTVAMAATAQKKRYKGRTTARVSKAKNAQEGSSHSFQKHS